MFPVQDTGNSVSYPTGNLRKQPMGRCQNYKPLFLDDLADQLILKPSARCPFKYFTTMDWILALDIQPCTEKPLANQSAFYNSYISAY